MSAMDVEDAAQGEGEGAEATSEVVEDLSVSDVVTKYKLAAEIVNKTLTGLVGYAKPGMRTVDLCVFGDQLLAQQCGQVFKSKKIDKGIAFPTCVSANDCVSHYSPVTSDPNIYVLKEGDLVKVDVGVHIDGYPAVAAHTFVLQGDTPGPVAGRAADVLQAAYLGAEAAVKLVSPESTNSDITAALQQVATDFGVTPAQGVLMHQMKRFVIDGNSVVLGREDGEQKVEEFNFETAQVYTVDVVMSTGEGKPIERDARTTVFKRYFNEKYNLKMKASRNFLSEVDRAFQTFPFTLRALQDEKQARMGVVECVKHELLHAFPVLWEKPGDLVAHFKYTVLVLPTGTAKVTGIPVPAETWQSEKKPSEGIQAILARSTKTKKKKKKKKAAAAAAAGAGDAAAPPAPPGAAAMETD